MTKKQESSLLAVAWFIAAQLSTDWTAVACMTFFAFYACGSAVYTIKEALAK